MSDIKIDKQAFSSEKEPDRGFTVKAFYLKEPNNGDALIEIFRDGNPYRRFLYPAYKIWNIAAHFSDIVTGEIEGNFSGYDMAGWTGFGVVPIRELPLSEQSEMYKQLCKQIAERDEEIKALRSEIKESDEQNEKQRQEIVRLLQKVGELPLRGEHCEDCKKFELQELLDENLTLRSEIKQLTEERNFWVKDAENWNKLARGCVFDIKRIEDDLLLFVRRLYNSVETMCSFDGTAASIRLCKCTQCSVTRERTSTIMDGKG